LEVGRPKTEEGKRGELEVGRREMGDRSWKKRKVVELEEGRSWEIKTEELGDKRMIFGKAPTGRKLLV